ncbi:7587_t:CDS:1, partial [Ambispora leptoticha]
MEPSQEELRKKKITNLAPSPFQQTKFTRTSSIRSIIQLFSQFNKEELVEKNEK